MFLPGQEDIESLQLLLQEHLSNLITPTTTSANEKQEDTEKLSNSESLNAPIVSVQQGY